MRYVGSLAGVGVVVVLGCVAGFVGNVSEARHLPADKTMLPESEFASSRACRSCHPDEYDSWRRTYHRTMTQEATPEAIAQPWDGITLHDSGRDYHLIRDGDRFFVDMPRMGTRGAHPDERVVLPVVQTTGSHHMQSYWLPVPWLEDEPDVAARARFDTYCASCHDKGGRGVDGQEGTLFAANVGANRVKFLGPDDETHIDILDRLRSDDVASIASYVERIQFPGRLTMFPFTYLLHENRWVHDDFAYIQPGRGDYAVEPYGNHWDEKCDGCHATYPDYRWDEDALRGFSEAVELGIACEECHGPAAAHVRNHQNPMARYRRYLTDGDDVEDIVNPEKLSPKLATSTCAQCHAELIDKEPGVEAFVPGQPIEDYAHVIRYGAPAHPQWLSERLEEDASLFRNNFWRDGTIFVAGRDYNGLVETACYTRGEMSCLSCHSMHASEPNDMLRDEALGNGACTSCHEELEADVSAHTHHDAASSGSQCYNCHMPHTTWGLLGAMRAHRVDSPSVVRDVETGRPNACNLCHLDLPLGETASYLTEWYAQPQPDLTEEQRRVAASVLWLLKGNGLQRAVTAWHMSWPPALETSGNGWEGAFLSQVLNDPYPAVRHSAGRSLTALPGFESLAYDYTHSPWEQETAVASARKLWLSRVGGYGNRPALLMTNGSLDWRQVAALLALRDDSHIEVDE